MELNANTDFLCNLAGASSRKPAQHQTARPVGSLLPVNHFFLSLSVFASFTLVLCVRSLSVYKLLAGLALHYSE